MKIEIHDPKDFKQAHLSSVAESILLQIRELDEHISRMIVSARELQNSLKK